MKRQRLGAIAEKVGMTCVFLEGGVRVPVTLLKMGGCRVVAKIEREDGRLAMQLGFGEKKHPTKPMEGYFRKAGVPPQRILKEFPVTEEGLLPVGTLLSTEHFFVGQYVDVTGTTIGKGFAGGMKRHNFSGLRATHGVSVSHRSHGSTGNRKSPAKVFKGKKMAGHMGCDRVTVQHLKVIATDEALGVIAVKGAVPGFASGIVFVRDSVKKPLTPQHAFPGVVREVSQKEHADAPSSQGIPVSSGDPSHHQQEGVPS